MPGTIHENLARVRAAARIPGRYLACLTLLAILAVFVTFNKAAFEGYFSDDDFSSLGMTRFVPWPELIRVAGSLVFEANIRPTGMMLYKFGAQHRDFALRIMSR